MILDLEYPQVLTEAVTICCKQCASLVKREPLLATFGCHLSTKKVRCWALGCLGDIECLSLFRCDVCDLCPFPLLGMRYRLLLNFLSVFILIFVYILVRLEDHLNV